MTIIAGFRCKEGLVVCADTQETFGPSKRDVPKLRFEGEGLATDTPLAIAICGAGHGPFIDRLVDQAWEDVQASTTLDEACEAIKQSIENMYKHYGRIFQAGECPTADLIFGVKANGGTKLFYANGPIINEKSYYSSGSGYYIADFISSRMHNQHLSLRQGVILAAYILFQAKEHVDGCGGESHIAVLRDEGMSGLVNSAKVKTITDLLKTADMLIGSSLFDIADLEKDATTFKRNMGFLIESLKSQREYTRQKRNTEFSQFEELHRILSAQEPEKTDEFGLPLLPKNSSGDIKE